MPEEAIAKLRSIFEKGLGYAEAFATVELIIDNSPGASHESIRKRALEIKPHLEREVKEACASLLV
ncbi:MAG: hypothetical protein A3205_02250 [Methanomassiliicoccales archaeon Mx-03]|nr:MAG: hypothetical protein A3205_02250 [Methanomassiliicoccales archaeon Mx-03]